MSRNHQRKQNEAEPKVEELVPASAPVEEPVAETVTEDEIGLAPAVESAKSELQKIDNESVQEAKELPPTYTKAIGVRALRMGYIHNRRRKEGDEFVLRPYKGLKEVIEKGRARRIQVVITAEQQFSSEWMERVDGVVTEKKAEPKLEAMRAAMTLDGKAVKSVI